MEILEDTNNTLQSVDNLDTPQTSADLKQNIENAKNNDNIIIEPGEYNINNINLDKNITIQGNGNPRDIVINGEKKSSIFLIRNPNVFVTFKNITFINGQTDNFGGAISIETGNVYVDNCIFINNTALDNTNAGAISNYGTKKEPAYLSVTNSLFINNHADHDGGAITTCYASSDIINCVFINNSAHRDGGAIRVSVYGKGNVQDCIFMYNHADEWGGAYYSWSGESNINRCIFMNNTAGTNGGAVMVSGNLNLENSIIVNNDGGETGGSFYIQQPMYNVKTYINVKNNIITNNSSPLGKEIFIKWDDAYNLYPNFNDNDWGDENPNDSNINDPNNVTSRIKVGTTTKLDLFNRLNFSLLNNYRDLIEDYFPDNFLDEIKNYGSKDNQNSSSSNEKNKNQQAKSQKTNLNSSNNTDNEIITNSPKTIETSNFNTNTNAVIGNSTSHGEDEKAYEINKTTSVSKQSSTNIVYLIAILAIICLLIIIGYKRYEKEE